MRRILIITLLTFSSWCSSQKGNGCKQVIKDYNNQFTNLENPKGKTVYLIDYTTEIYYWDKTVPAQKQRVQMYIGKKQTYFKSDFVEIYSDEDYVATVFKNRKKIVFTLSPEVADQLGQYKKMMELRNFIVDSSEVKKCDVNSNNMGVLELDPSRLEMKKFYVKSLQYQYNVETGNIVKIITKYSKKYDLKKMVVINNQIDLNYRFKGFKPVKKIFFNPNGSLVNMYKDYEIIVE